MHPWDYRRYTLRELLYRLDHVMEEKKVQFDIMEKSMQGEWVRMRWLVANFANIMGSKISSVHRIVTFPWEKPEEKPQEDLLSRFPKTLKNGR